MHSLKRKQSMQSSKYKCYPIQTMHLVWSVAIKSAFGYFPQGVVIRTLVSILEAMKNMAPVSQGMTAGLRLLEMHQSVIGGVPSWPPAVQDG